MKRYYLLFYTLFSIIIFGFSSCDDSNNEEFSDSLNLGGEKIYVVGHKSPDTDAVASTMAYTELLQMLGYDCEARIAGKLNSETAFIFDTFGVKVPPILSNAEGLRIIIVDHNEYLQAVDGMEKATIVKMVDNHGSGSINNALSYDTTAAVGSTSTLVYQCFKKNNLTVSKKIASLLVAGILSDTRNLRVDKSFNCDSVAINELLPIAEISDKDNFYLRMHRFDDNYDGMADLQIFLGDYKSYEVNGYKYGMGIADVPYDSLLPNMRKRMLEAMEEFLPSSGLDFITCKIDADTTDCTNFIYIGDMSEDVMKKAFGSDFKDSYTAEFKDGYILFLPHAGRKTITPHIDDVLMNYKD